MTCISLRYVHSVIIQLQIESGFGRQVFNIALAVLFSDLSTVM